MSDPVDPANPAPNPPPQAGSPPPQPVPYETPVGATIDQDSRTLAMVAHILNFTLLGPLIVYLVKKGQNAFLDTEAKEALNFSLSCFILTMLFWGTHWLPLGCLFG